MTNCCTCMWVRLADVEGNVLTMISVFKRRGFGIPTNEGS